jgi:hypothetical protein
MEQAKRFFPIALALLLGIILQGLLIISAAQDTPTRAVVKFTKAYFNLDRSMSEYLCSQFTSQEDVDIVDAYLHRIAEEARAQGFSFDYMRSGLLAIHTDLISQNNSEALVRITAARKRNINPVYTIVSLLFFIGETYSVDEVITVVKEEGEWKVCGKVFSLAT